jgi:hypothetical protein
MKWGKQPGTSLVLLRRLYIRQFAPLALGFAVKHRAFGNLNQILIVRGAMHLILCWS